MVLLESIHFPYKKRVWSPSPVIIPLLEPTNYLGSYAGFRVEGPSASARARLLSRGIHRRERGERRGTHHRERRDHRVGRKGWEWRAVASTCTVPARGVMLLSSDCGNPLSVSLPQRGRDYCCLYLCPGGTSPSPPFCNGAGSSPLPGTGEGVRGPSTSSGRTWFLVVARSY